MTDRLLGIEKKLGITITMPQICHFCGEEIQKKYGKDSDSLLFHSLDGNHDNWDQSNKVPAHKKCHIRYHSEHTTDHERHYGKPGVSGYVWQKKFINLGGANAIIVPKDWVRSEEMIHSRKMRGVYVMVVRVDENNERLELTPMWEDEK